MTFSTPAIAVVGSNGFVGKAVMPFAYEALAQKRIRELRLLSRKFDLDDLKRVIAKGATVQNASYSNIKSLTLALTGIDVVINMMGFQGDDWIQNKQNLVEAMVGAGVKVYIPSEFGTASFDSNYRDNVMFQIKQQHIEDVEGRGIKTVGIYNSLFMEQAFHKWLGFDNDREEWNIVGDGNVPVSLTAKDDVGRFTIEAAITAYHEPDRVPRRCKIETITRTLREYAAILDHYSTTGNKLKLNIRPLDKAKLEWEEQKLTMPIGLLGPLIGIMMAEGTLDHSDGSANEVLNPGESKWKTKSFKEYAKQEQGRPWRGPQPF